MTDRTETEHHHAPKVTAREARQGRANKPVLYVLIAATVGAAIGVWAVYAFLNPGA